jgi:DtxR family transcriptional regulator, Mn-dependent transcriptional regulator
VTARREPNPNSESVDNYLKAILLLGGPEEHRVASNALARRLGVAPASVTNMLQKLAGGSPSLVEYERHRGVLLSSQGKKRALEVVRHHRLIETFLYEVLDYPIDEVHDEAERLEHFISERFEERIAAKLGHPKIDPHGHCIPTMDGSMPKQNSILLTDAMHQGIYLVDSIAPGVRLRVREKPSITSYAVSIGRATTPVTLQEEAASSIRVCALRK